MRDAYDVIKGPLITEKLGQLTQGANITALKVAVDANKVEIRRAVETIWGVKVERVRTMNFQGKMKRMGRFEGRKPSWKKAYVTLAEGESIPEMS